MSCSIFIKSYHADLIWLTHCLKSIDRFATGFDEVVILLPEGTDYPATKEKVFHEEEPKDVDGYCVQQEQKSRADQFCRSDYIMFVDSDVIFTEPCSPDDFFVDGKPIWLMTPMADIITGDPNFAAWQRCMSRFFGREPEWEYMRRSGQIVPRWALPVFRDLCQQLHGKSFLDWIRDQPYREVTEFNLFGMAMHQHYPSFFHFHDTRYGLPPLKLKQYWSHGGLTPEIEKEINEILA